MSEHKNAKYHMCLFQHDYIDDLDKSYYIVTIERGTTVHIAGVPHNVGEIAKSKMECVIIDSYYTFEGTVQECFNILNQNTIKVVTPSEGKQLEYHMRKFI